MERETPQPLRLAAMAEGRFSPLPRSGRVSMPVMRSSDRVDAAAHANTRVSVDAGGGGGCDVGADLGFGGADYVALARAVAGGLAERLAVLVPDDVTGGARAGGRQGKDGDEGEKRERAFPLRGLPFGSIDANCMRTAEMNLGIKRTRCLQSAPPRGITACRLK